LKVGVVLDQDVGYDDIGTRLRKSQRILAAQSARRAGDNRNLSTQVKHFPTPSI
jgi:hypothetical protein